MSFRRPVLLGLILASALQVQASLVVREIDVRGLKSTNRWVVERELYFQVGDTITDADISAAQKRLRNLNVFTDAQLSADTTGAVIVDVSEAWPILPVVSVKLTRGKYSDVYQDPPTFWKNLEVTIGLRDLNFRRNASEVFAYAHVGTSNGFFVGYETRWLSPRLPLAVRGRVQYLEVSDRHADIFDSTRHMRVDGGGLEIGTHAGARGRIGLGTTLERVQQEHEWPAEGRTYNTAWLSPFAILDHRDLEWWPSRGGLALVRGDFGFGTQSFVRSQYELRGYLPLKSWYPASTPHRPPVIALMIGAATSTSSTPSFAHYYAGFDDGYRGNRYDLSESAGIITGQVEWRFPISPEGTYSVPFIGHWGRHWPIGIAGVLFAQRTELQIDNIRTELFGYGGGIYLRVPYVQLIELASARDKEGKPEFTLSTSIRF